MIVRAPGYDDTAIPPQFVTCEWLLDHAASDGLRDVAADPPLSACGWHFVELD